MTENQVYILLKIIALATEKKKTVAIEELLLKLQTELIKSARG